MCYSSRDSQGTEVGARCVRASLQASSCHCVTCPQEAGWKVGAQRHKAWAGARSWEEVLHQASELSQDNVRRQVRTRRWEGAKSPIQGPTESLGPAQSLSQNLSRVTLTGFCPPCFQSPAHCGFPATIFHPHAVRLPVAPPSHTGLP